MGVGGLISIAGLALQVLWNLIASDDWRLHKWQWIATAALPTAAVIAINLAYRLLMAPSTVHQNQEREHSTAIQKANDEVASLRRELARLTPVLEMAEEDPRVFLKPLNRDMVARGLIRFELLNDGQRVNPAQGITIQTISCIPLVHFEYVDSLRANENKTITPTIETCFSGVCNIIAELDKAWQEAWEREETKNQVMIDEAEFPFEIRISYQDFRPRRFETTVSLRYCPVEYQALLNADSLPRREYTFLKVTGTNFRRLA